MVPPKSAANDSYRVGCPKQNAARSSTPQGHSALPTTSFSNPQWR